MLPVFKFQSASLNFKHIRTVGRLKLQSVSSGSVQGQKVMLYVEYTPEPCKVFAWLMKDQMLLYYAVVSFRKCQGQDTIQNS